MQDPLEIWNAEIPDMCQAGLHLAVGDAVRAAFDMCKAAFPGYSPLNYIVGQNRFAALQHRLLEFGRNDPSLRSRTLFHINGLPFTQLFTSRIHITTASIDSENAYPQMSLFREQEQTEQLAFLRGAKVLICHLAVYVDPIDLGEASAARVHFPDGRGGYLEPFVDLKAKKIAPVVLPVEKVADLRHTPVISPSSNYVPGYGDRA